MDNYDERSAVFLVVVFHEIDVCVYVYHISTSIPKALNCDFWLHGDTEMCVPVPVPALSGSSVSSGR